MYLFCLARLGAKAIDKLLDVGDLADEKTYSELAPDELTELLTRAGTKRQALEQIEENWLDAVARLESHDEN